MDSLRDSIFKRAWAPIVSTARPWARAAKSKAGRLLRSYRDWTTQPSSSDAASGVLPFPPPPKADPPRPVVGVIRVSVYGPKLMISPHSHDSGPALTHVTTWVNGPWYRGHSNNDLRGYIDGRYRKFWNQTDQIHVRIGRNKGKPVLGERELFRNLHRWDGITLPQGARVLGATFELAVETGSNHCLDLFLYRVHKDWHPGCGGVNRDNGSEPAADEVWWNERMRGSLAWGLPGAGFSSDNHANADTPVTALAVATYTPGDSHLSFHSPALTEYVQEQVDSDRPLLFLVKLSDDLEDQDGTILALFTSNCGDTCTIAHRPRLRLEWTNSAEIRSLEHHIVLEHGRSTVLPRLDAPDMCSLAVSFQPESGFATPRVQVRGGRGESLCEWLDAGLPVDVEWDWVEVRLDSFENPVPIGQELEVRFRETEVRTGAPESQPVHWLFTSPSGRAHSSAGQYLGEYTWEIRFAPDEVGRWSYCWTHQFKNRRYFSPTGHFDVTVPDADTAEAALVEFGSKVARSKLANGKQRICAFGDEFKRLERAVMRLEAPETFDLTGGQPNPRGAMLDALRVELSGSLPPQTRIPPFGDQAVDDAKVPIA
jgi:hypothetical protein